ncbi:MAG: phosphatidylserine decarboxylase family protein [Deltaproteobacteria bacterium]|nr:phosphatidylserine decarboxylase family protein [Deltaproteobacteria bacterium]
MRRSTLRIPVAKEGAIFILPLAALSLILWILWFTACAGFFSLLTLFVVYFFRDPERSIPPGEKAVLAPADGKIIKVEPCWEEYLLKGPTLKVSIFMSLFNVHVNRIPLTGRIIDSSYHTGKFIRANLDKASTMNEQNALLMEAPDGTRLLFVQIAGLIARRIVCWIKKGDVVERGCRFGMIRFGSRVDVYLPANTRLQAQIGQKVLGGQTILGVLT